MGTSQITDVKLSYLNVTRAGLGGQEMVVSSGSQTLSRQDASRQWHQVTLSKAALWSWAVLILWKQAVSFIEGLLGHWRLPL